MVRGTSSSAIALSATTGADKGAGTGEIPDKLYFPIREVSRITGVEPYVLRFWETQFPMFRPFKSKSGHRQYRRKDIEMVLEIKRLLYQQGFTIPGARNHLKKKKRSRSESSPSGGRQTGLPFSEPSRSAFGRIRRELDEILTILQKT